jgi:hypothetical protein
MPTSDGSWSAAMRKQRRVGIVVGWGGDAPGRKASGNRRSDVRGLMPASRCNARSLANAVENSQGRPMTPGKVGRAKRLHTRQRAAEAVSNHAPEVIGWRGSPTCAHAAARDRMAAAANRPSRLTARTGFAAGHRVTDLAISSSRQADLHRAEPWAAAWAASRRRALHGKFLSGLLGALNFGGDIHPRQLGRSIGVADRVLF